MKRYIFSIQITGLGDNEKEALQDALDDMIQLKCDGYYNDVTMATLIKIEDIE